MSDAVKDENKKSWKFLVDANSVSEKRLNRTAIIAADRTYTYRQMFKKWERYAEVFSALNITARNKSRLAIFDCGCAESSFAIYGANMTGASITGFQAAYISEKYPLDLAIKGEGITDLFINDVVVNKRLLLNVARKKMELGLRNIIVVKVPIEHEKMDRKLIDISNKNYEELKKVPGVLFMDELLQRYDTTDIQYGPDAQAQDAFIMHTSGTTKGISKPVPLSDLALNSAAKNAAKSKKFKKFENGAVVMNTMVATSVYGLVNQLHEPFAFGCTVVILPMSNSNPIFAEAISDYKVNVLFLTPFYFEVWSKFPPEAVPDFTSVKCIVVGGAYMSAEARERYKKLVNDHGGSDPQFINGYGMSETAGACIIQTDEVNNDSIGYPLPGVKVKIYDEKEKKYYNISDGHTGVLYIHSDSITLGKIDDKVFYETEKIDGLPYICTYDVVSVNEDGSLSCRGRANRFFINNDGVKFDAGLVETTIQAQPGVEAAALVPWYDKLVTHDTVPILYIKLVDTVSDAAAPAEVTRILRDVFVVQGKEKETNLPMQCVIVKDLPRNNNGKVDIFKITQEDVPGQRFIIRSIRDQSALKDIVLEPVTDLETGIANGEVPKELSQAWTDVRQSAQDETVLNTAGLLLRQKIMGAFADPGMIMAQQTKWFMDTMQNIWNTAIKMWNDAVAALQAQQKKMPQMPYSLPQVPQTANGAAPQAAQFPGYALPQAPQNANGAAPQAPQFPGYVMPQAVQNAGNAAPQTAQVPNYAMPVPQMFQMPNNAAPQACQMPQMPYMAPQTPPSADAAPSENK